jgi:homopolymeric O-antigen transport system ATP-binding protein
MSETVVKIEHLWKQYRLGVIGHGTLTHDLQTWWARQRGREDPNARLDQVGAAGGGQVQGDRFWALRDVTLDVHRGEVLGIIGRNGAGKSTLLKILSRVTTPTRGSVRIRGRIASLLEVGTGFHKELTGRENIYLNGAILGMSRQEVKGKFDEIAAFAEIDEFLDTPVKRYSSGMYVRLAFAVAAHLEPEILVVDEVLAVGDAAFQKKCMGKMKNIAGQGRTVLFVSHNMAAVSELTRRCLFLTNGKLTEDNATKFVVQRYLTERKALKYERELSSVARSGNIARQWKFVSVKIKCNELLIAKEPITIELAYESYAESRGVVLGLGINNYMGSRLISCRSEDENSAFDIEKNCTGIISVTIANPLLAPGVYVLQLGAHIGTSYLLDYLGEALEFEIFPDGTDKWEMQSQNLGVRPVSKWNIL